MLGQIFNLTPYVITTNLCFRSAMEEATILPTCHRCCRRGRNLGHHLERDGRW